MYIGPVSGTTYAARNAMINTMSKNDIIKTARLLYAKGLVEDAATVYRDLSHIWDEDVDMFLILAQVERKERYKYAKSIDQRRQKIRLKEHLKWVDQYAAMFERYTERELQQIFDVVAIINQKSLDGGAMYAEFATLFYKIAKTAASHA